MPNGYRFITSSFCFRSYSRTFLNRLSFISNGYRTSSITFCRSACSQSHRISTFCLGACTSHNGIVPFTLRLFAQYNSTLFLIIGSSAVANNYRTISTSICLGPDSNVIFLGIFIFCICTTANSNRAFTISRSSSS